nr:helix-turn-helix transcriptional regulator [Vibrio ostreicida]
MTWLSTLRQGVSLSLADPQHDQIYIEPLTKIKKSLPFERVLILLSVIHQFFCDCQLDADDRIVQPQAKLAHLTEFLQGEENKSLTSCAEALNMSDSTLKRWLKNDFDTTFTELYCQLRLKEAQKLLVRTGIPVNVVAEQSGFNSVRAFNEAFKKHLQVTPVVYRSQYKWRTVRR